MDEEFLFLNPGPVPVSRAVRRAMDAPMVSHRSAAFDAAIGALEQEVRPVRRVVHGRLPVLLAGELAQALLEDGIHDEVGVRAEFIHDVVPDALNVLRDGLLAHAVPPGELGLVDGLRVARLLDALASSARRSVYSYSVGAFEAISTEA